MDPPETQETLARECFARFERPLMRICLISDRLYTPCYIGWGFCPQLTEEVPALD